MIGSEHTGRPSGGHLKIARSRGAASGFLLVLLGLWGALVPFVGPYFDFAFEPDQPWVWTAGRGWLEVLPGVVTVVGGFLALSSRNRVTAMFGGWLTVTAGAWFVVGRALADPLGLGGIGAPAATGSKRVWLELTYFYGLGALVIFLGALAVGRLSVRSVRDVEYASRPVNGAESGHAPTSNAPIDNGTSNAPIDNGPSAPAHGTDDTGAGPVVDSADVAAEPQRPKPRRRGLRGLFRGGRSNRSMVHH